ncbi:hypothetical protein PGAL8A_00014200 [Plasmodium gallinaceum]|uniref:Uncharacterized protein n=1 Tax=Plasmodium gallinaceum TaxID=5849 RepID=A0A1J1GWI9_PLAGA|nr:hypothetical protein PGAL8A_00014200 [Plasmodium gallinaceum]CRG95373.1 hypothetical protein PGAL8A_00014200 [Plasmodium gallinaceum]
MYFLNSTEINNSIQNISPKCEKNEFFIESDPSSEEISDFSSCSNCNDIKTKKLKHLEQIIFLIEYEENMFSSPNSKSEIHTTNWFIIFQSIIEELKFKLFKNENIKICIILYKSHKVDKNFVFYKLCFLFDLQYLSVNLIKDLIDISKLQSINMFDIEEKIKNKKFQSILCSFEDVLLLLNRIIIYNSTDKNVIYVNKIIYYTQTVMPQHLNINILKRRLESIEKIGEFFYICLKKEKKKNIKILEEVIAESVFKNYIKKKIILYKLKNCLMKIMSLSKNYTSNILSIVNGLNVHINIYLLSSKEKQIKNIVTIDKENSQLIPKTFYIGNCSSEFEKNENLKYINIGDLKEIINDDEKKALSYNNTDFIKITHFLNYEFLQIENNISSNYFIFPQSNYYHNKYKLKKNKNLTEENYFKQKDKRNVEIFNCLLSSLIKKKKIAIGMFFRHSSPLRILLIPYIPPSVNKKKKMPAGFLLKQYPFFNDIKYRDCNYMKNILSFNYYFKNNVSNFTNKFVNSNKYLSDSSKKSNTKNISLKKNMAKRDKLCIDLITNILKYIESDDFNPYLIQNIYMNKIKMAIENIIFNEKKNYSSKLKFFYNSEYFRLKEFYLKITSNLERNLISKDREFEQAASKINEIRNDIFNGSINKYKTRDLLLYLEYYNLPKYGKKNDIIERIKNHVYVP